MTVLLNGNTYESAEPIADGVLSAENVSKVEIDGEAYDNMILICKYEYEGGTRFALREMTEAEAENKSLRAQLDDALQSVAELTIIVSAIMAQ